MADSPIANQRLRVSTYAKFGKGDSKWLDRGTYVKFINKCYLPIHCKDYFGDYNEAHDVAVYTCYGIGIVARSDLDWNVY